MSTLSTLPPARLPAKCPKCGTEFKLAAPPGAGRYVTGCGNEQCDRWGIEVIAK
jgi:hypothetical protein